MGLEGIIPFFVCVRFFVFIRSSMFPFFCPCFLSFSGTYKCLKKNNIILTPSAPTPFETSRLLAGQSLRGGGGKTYRKAKPREDGLSETIFRDLPKAVSEAVSRGKFWVFLRDFQEDVNGEKRTVKKYGGFLVPIFHGLCRVFHGL